MEVLQKQKPLVLCTLNQIREGGRASNWSKRISGAFRVQTQAYTIFLSLHDIEMRGSCKAVVSCGTVVQVHRLGSITDF